MAPAKASALSNNPGDKLFACLNYPVIKASTDYVSAPSYFDACRAWYDGLSWEHRGIVALVINAYTDGGEIVAERIAVGPAPGPAVSFLMISESDIWLAARASQSGARPSYL
jgi:hypothetical protein